MSNKRDRAAFTDLFIQRPVLSVVVSLLIVLFGLHAYFTLSVREFPKLNNTVISITTAYPGASAQVVEGFVTTPIEQALSGTQGVDYMRSSSSNGSSTIQATLRLNANPSTVFSDILAQVQRVKKKLPNEVEDPIVKKQTGSKTALMYIAFDSKVLSSEQITDYLIRVVQPQLETVPGVSEANILGPSYMAMRIWIDPQKCAAYGISMAELSQALKNNNLQAAAGSTKGQYLSIPITANSSLADPKSFEQLIVKQTSKGAIRVRDLARVELGASSYDEQVKFNGRRAVFMSLSAAPEANPLDAIAAARAKLPSLHSQLPSSLELRVVYDATQYIRASTHEVIQTIIEAALIVVAIIYCFLGSVRTMLIPMVTIPLSLIGVLALMAAMGYSLNLLTLLALVLAIGMVVDDAIVVVENIFRHIEQGEPPFTAAIRGAREIATPVISMTITLAAVYLPIALMGGVTGALFKEFALTLAGAVLVSGVIALTLSPMMTAILLKQQNNKGRLVARIDALFLVLKQRYQGTLERVVGQRATVISVAVLVFLSCVFMFMTAKHEMAPTEDQGVVFSAMSGPQTATLDYMKFYSDQYEPVYNQAPGRDNYFVITNAGGSGMSGFIMKPWNQRHVSQQQALQQIQAGLSQIAGIRAQVFPLPSLPVGGRGLPIEYVVKTTMPYHALEQVMDGIVNKAKSSGLFMFINGSLKLDKPEIVINFDRDKVAQLGLDLATVTREINAAITGNYINYFTRMGRNYEVIAQLEDKSRQSIDAISAFRIKSAAGDLVPLASIAHLTAHAVPNSRDHFQQMNAATIEGLMMPGVTLGQALDYLQQVGQSMLPVGYSADFGGQSRQYVQEGGALTGTFLFSLIVIFLVLAAQFNSFRDSIVILISVPMAICGALLPLSWGLASINIYTQVGMVTLIGLISKHGILMVDFANELLAADSTLTRGQAIVQAAAVRLRPVLMTTAAMILGVVPLLTASGAGAVSRFDIGLVVAAGMFVGTLFTLFILPTVYTLARKTLAGFIACVGVFCLVEVLLLQMII